MTLLEVVLALGLSTLVLIAVVSFYTTFTQKMQTMSDTIENTTDIESGQQIILRDLKAIDPNYGVLGLLDDTNKLFFEHFPDVPERNLALDPITQRPSRTYTMKLAGGFTEVTFILHDTAAAEVPTLNYDPSWAFEILPCLNQCKQASDMRTPKFRTPKGVNFDDKIASDRPRVTHTDHGREIVDFKGFWNKRQLLMFDSPSTFRPETFPPPDSRSVAPRPPFFIGMVGDDLIAFNQAPISLFNSGTQTNLLLRSLPTDPTQVIDSAEKFFLRLPSSGGGQPMVRLRPVKLVKYKLTRMYPTIDPNLPKDEIKRRTNAARLWRYTLNNNGEFSEIDHKSLIAEKVKSLQFFRATATDKAVSFELSKEELKRGGEP